MKTKLNVLLLFVCTAISVQATEKKVCSGKSLSEMGAYEITMSDDNSNPDFISYVLKYENCEECFTIMVCKGEDCKNFLVYGKDIDLQYKLSKNKVFGITKIDKKFRRTDKDLLAKRINREQLYRQRVISSTPKTQKGYLGLIACYLPQVLNN